MKVSQTNHVIPDARFLYKPTRRRFLHTALSLPIAAGILDLLMPSDTFAVAGSGDVPEHALRFTTQNGRDPGHKAIIVFMQGGLSFFDTFDPKTHSSIKGPYNPITTASRDIRLTEILQPLARHANNFVVINNLRGGSGFHDQGAALVMTSSSKVVDTSFYSNAIYKNPFVEFSNVLTNDARGEVGYVVLHQSSKDQNGYNRLWDEPWGGLHHKDPITVYSAYDTNTGAFTNPFGGAHSVPIERYRERMRLLDAFNSSGHTLVGPSVERHDRAYRQANSLLDGDFNKSFNLNEEPQVVLARYGDTKVGKQFLLARRMLQNGARIIAVNDGNYDHHQNMKGDMDVMLPNFAKAMNALMDDVNRMSEKVFVVVVSEFGRTPVINNQRGRDHWTDAYGMVVISNDRNEIGGGRTIGLTDDSGRIVGPSFDASMVSETILDLLKLGRFEKRGEVVTSKRFPYIDIKNERVVG